MITICPNGGLGNQLFQYAAGRALALHHGVGLEVDTWHFGAQPEVGTRPLLLHKLGLPARWRFYPARGVHAPHSLAQRLRRRIVQPLLRHVAVDASILSEDAFFALSTNSVLIGYFQSLRFFGRYLHHIRSEIDLAKAVSPTAAKWREMLQSGPWCAIQVRRGDYVGNPNHDVVNFREYYPLAMTVVREEIRNVQFVVFSDDAGWCKLQVEFSGLPVHASHGPNQVADAMYLMSKCRAQIIANSSYGWWGAALSCNDAAGPVILPGQWGRGFPTSALGLNIPNWIVL